MDKRRLLLWNKMMLGDLRLGELRKIVSIEGQYTIGQHWLPIYKARKRGEYLGIWMWHDPEPCVVASLDAVVKVEGKFVRLDVPSMDIRGGFRIPTDHVELKIMLYDDPFPTGNARAVV